MKIRIEAIAAIVASLAAGQRFTADGQIEAAQLQVAVQQALDEAVEPTPVDPLQAQLDKIHDQVESLHVALVAALEGRKA